MVLSKMKQLKKDKGFTIVELLIVIVVIAILAAITIVAYSGITARANTTKSQSNAETVQKIAEAINADSGSYPASLGIFTSGWTGGNVTVATAKLPTGVSVAPATTTLTSTTGLTTVIYQCLTSCTSSTGGKISYFDFTTGTLSTTIVYVGAGTSGGTYVNPA